MLNVGDPHNFGKRVKFTSDPTGKPAFFKPRSIFWERQFLNADSALRTKLLQCQGFDPLGPLGNIWFSSDDNDHTGYVEPVISEACSSAKLLKSFAQVSAIATTLGIVDLHSSNCLSTPFGRFALIDIECPFFRCESLAESALVSRRNLPAESAGAAHLMASLTIAGPTGAADLILEHFKYFGVLQKSAHAFTKCFGEIEMEHVPIRVILRATKDYSNRPESTEAFIPEEIEQLERGDIPYFFRFLGDPTLYFYGADFTALPVKEQGRLWSAVQRSAVPIEILFAQERLQKLKFQSTLVLAKRISELAKLNYLRNEEMEMSSLGNSLVLKFGNIQIEARSAQ